MSQVILHLGVPYTSGCNSLLSCRSEDGGFTSNCGTLCRADVPWQDRYIEGCGAAQVLDVGGALVDHVPSDMTLFLAAPVMSFSKTNESLIFLVHL